MRIDLVRSGGFAGLQLRASVDTGSLAAADAAAVEELVRGADLPALSAGPPALPAAAGPAADRADRFSYDLTLHSDGQRHELTVADGWVPPQLRPLLDHLVQVARRR